MSSRVVLQVLAGAGILFSLTVLVMAVDLLRHLDDPMPQVGPDPADQ